MYTFSLAPTPEMEAVSTSTTTIPVMLTLKRKGSRKIEGEMPAKKAKKMMNPGAAACKKTDSDCRTVYSMVNKTSKVKYDKVTFTQSSMSWITLFLRSLRQDHVSVLHKYQLLWQLFPTVALPAHFYPPHSRTSTARPLGAVTQKHSTKICRIHRLSWPRGRSVNDAIPNSEASINYDEEEGLTSSLVRGGDTKWRISNEKRQTLGDGTVAEEGTQPSPCQGKGQGAGCLYKQSLGPKLAKEARGPPTNGPGAGPQQHPSLLDLRPLDIELTRPLGPLSTKRYTNTPGSFTGDTERNGGGWMPDECSGLVLGL
ncbi:hypothetical protein DFH08DRAFT_804050 [Mycena albidolilacea]|uniref:Uncharacterized protein n=1 Tax=Mycena albidolilacea TaxID=1033008 RepID=A0AAD7ACG5_9AGAR|nr:hypothetical protein DFH08DRAFT_804050 [Mycena albidolilacea]